MSGSRLAIGHWHRPLDVRVCFALPRAAGCILAELLGRKPLFPGRDFLHTMTLVCKVVGTPTEAEIAGVHGERARAYLASMPHFERGNMAEYFPGAEPLAVDLAEKLLVFE